MLPDRINMSEVDRLKPLDPYVNVCAPFSAAGDIQFLALGGTGTNEVCVKVTFIQQFL